MDVSSPKLTLSAVAALRVFLETMKMSVSKGFARLTSWCAKICGHPLTFIVSVLTVILWGVCGPFFNYSDTWQLVINTGTTVITFLVVFLIQSDQNRNVVALHLKLDELIAINEKARNDLIRVEKLPEVEIERLRQEH